MPRRSSAKNAVISRRGKTARRVDAAADALMKDFHRTDLTNSKLPTPPGNDLFAAGGASATQAQLGRNAFEQLSKNISEKLGLAQGRVNADLGDGFRSADGSRLFPKRT